MVLVTNCFVRVLKTRKLFACAASGSRLIHQRQHRLRQKIFVLKKVELRWWIDAEQSCVIRLIKYDSARLTADSVVMQRMHRGEG